MPRGARAGLRRLDKARHLTQRVVGRLERLDADIDAIQQAVQVSCPRIETGGLEIVERVIQRGVDLSPGRETRLGAVKHAGGVLQREQIAANAV